MGHSLLDDCRTLIRNKELKAFHDQLRARLPAKIQPQNAESEGGVNRTLSFLSIHAQNGEGRLASLHNPPRVNRPERMFQIG